MGHTAAVAEEGENHTDPTVEECEVTELVSPKKPTELLLNGGGGNSNQTHPEESKNWLRCSYLCTFVLPHNLGQPVHYFHVIYMSNTT